MATMKMPCAVGSGVGDIEFTQELGSSPITIGENHKYMVLFVYRNSASPSVTYDSNNVTPYMATSYNSNYISIFKIPDVVAGKTVTIQGGQTLIFYMDY